MERSVGVTVSAVVALLGSLIALAIGMMTVLAFVAAPTPPSSPNFPGSPAVFRTVLFLVPLFYLLPAAWGITTSVGLLRLRKWARVSIVVFAALLAIFGLFGMFGALAMLAMPSPAMPPGARLDPNFFVMMRIFMMALTLGQLGLGIWWLVFFNRARVKEQFVPQRMAFAPYPPAAGTPPPPSLHPAPSSQPGQSPPLPPAPSLLNMPGRPLSITIIGWYLLVVSLLFPVNFFMRTPAVLLLKIVTGWPAMVYLLATLAVHVYVGVGLLRLRPAARLVGIAYFVFAFINSAVFFFAPGGQARMAKLLEIQQSMFPWMRQFAGADAFHFDIKPFMMIGAAGGLAFVLVPLCFLIINRQAFARSAAPAA